MQNTFDNTDKAERRRAERQRQMELMIAATTGRNLPPFVDEESHGAGGGGGDGGSSHNESSALFIPPSASEKWGGSSTGGSDGEREEEGSGIEKADVGGSDSRHGSSPPSRRSSESSSAMEREIAEGMHAPPLGATEAAQKFLWDDDDGGKSIPSRNFGGGSFDDDNAKNVNLHNASVFGSDSPAREGAGAKLLRGLVPTFGPDGGRGPAGGGGAQSFSARSFAPPPRAAATLSPVAKRSQSSRAAGLLGRQSDGLNIAPRRASDAEALTSVDLTGSASGRHLEGRYGGYDDDNLPPLGWADSSNEVGRMGRTAATAVAACCGACARREVKTAAFFVLGVIVVGAIAGSVTSSRSGAALQPPPPPPTPVEDGPRPNPADVGAVPVVSDPARLDAIIRRIVDSGATLRSDLAASVRPLTPQRRAVEWLANTDGRALDPSDDFLLQRFALAVLWYGTHDDDMTELAPDESAEWTNGENWMSDMGLCTWHGVACHESSGAASTDGNYEGDGMVSILSMPVNNILGELPQEVFTCLVEVKQLDLHGNNLGGTISTNIGRLQQLEYLDLGDNSFDGTIPTQVGWLENLENLDLSLNVISGRIPDTLGDLFDTLKECSLYSNKLQGTIPNSLSKLSRVQSLYLDTNDLTGTLPHSFGQLTKMIDLRVRDNELRGTIPSQLGEMKALEVLYLDTNSFSGSLPTEMARLVKMEEMVVYDNVFTGTLPTELSQMASLRHVYLDTNEFTGTIPPNWFEGFGQVVNLYLDHNQLDGEIPSEMGLMEKLEILNLGDNLLLGSIPTELGGLTALTELGLEENKLQGTVPESLGQVLNLETLLLHGNSLTGEMPGSVCKLVTGHALDNLTAPCLESDSFQCNCCSHCF